ncbi:hypothetical protein ACN38_g7373 [Penicillium nordicum]|uniref:Uncharacterized protein n=1 Tax=Penicillium nordicum TaxID=229535 RepID=A0A0M8P6L4_9EURO|nr:hypothetical protein ACN38_g7373 [Penicillium nordicum]
MPRCFRLLCRLGGIPISPSFFDRIYKIGPTISKPLPSLGLATVEIRRPRGKVESLTSGPIDLLHVSRTLMCVCYKPS